jgi:hypothetical protein
MFRIAARSLVIVVLLASCVGAPPVEPEVVPVDGDYQAVWWDGYVIPDTTDTETCRNVNRVVTLQADGIFRIEKRSPNWWCNFLRNAGGGTYQSRRDSLLTTRAVPHSHTLGDSEWIELGQSFREETEHGGVWIFERIQ